MTIEELKEFLSENKENEEVVNLISEVAPKPKLEDLLSSEDYSKKFESLLDSERSKAVESYKNNTLPKRVEERVKEELDKQKNGKKDPFQIKLEEMESKQQELMKQLEEKEKAEQREKLRNKALQSASEKNIPTNLIDYFLGEDEDSTMSNLEKLETTLTDYSKKVKEGVYKNSSSTISTESGDVKDQPGPDASKEEWKKYLEKNKK